MRRVQRQKSRYEVAGAFPGFSILGEASSRSGKEDCKSSTTTNLSGPIDASISREHGEVLVVANRPVVLHKLKEGGSFYLLRLEEVDSGYYREAVFNFVPTLRCR